MTPEARTSPAGAWLAARAWTLGAAVAAGALALPALIPGRHEHLAAVLELRGTGAGHGEWWRLLTGHFVHFSAQQLMLNLVAFGWLGCLCEPRMPRRYSALLLVSAFAVSGGVLWFHGDLVVYRGLSGIASAQFAAMVALRWRESGRTGGIGTAVPCLMSLVLFVGKTAWEIETGRALFAGGLGLGTAGPSPVAHLAGALAGLAVVLCPAASLRRPLALRPSTRVG